MADRGARRHPMERAGLLSWMTLHWLQPLIRLGAKKPLEMNDLPPVPQALRVEELGKRLARVYRAERDKVDAYNAKHNPKKPKKVVFLLVLLKCFIREWVVSSLFMMIYVAATVTSPLFIKALLRFLDDPDAYAQDPFLGTKTGVGIVVGFALTLFITAFSANTAFMMLCYVGAKLRAAVMHAVFKKSLVLSPTVTSGGSNGEIVNLMSNDSERIFFALLTSHMLLFSPILLIVCMILMVIEVGWGGVAGIVVVVILMPVQTKMGRQVGTEKRKMLKITDSRIGVTAEALSGINIIKMNSWEPQMSERIQDNRVEEMKLGRKVLFLMTINNWLLFIAPTLIALAVFAAYALSSGEELTIVTVYTVLALLNIIRFPLSILPRAVAALAQANVSGNRIEKFLRLPELDYNAMLKDAPAAPPAAPPKDSELAAAEHPESGSDDSASTGSTPTAPPAEPVISIEKGSFTWDDPGTAPEDRTKVLDDINLSISKGELVAIVGKVGSGKSSLLAAILREIGIQEGSIDVNLPGATAPASAEGSAASLTPLTSFPAISMMPPTSGAAIGPAPPAGAGFAQHAAIAYCAQEPWIQNATLRENILFQSAETVTAASQNGKAAAGDDASELLSPVDETLFRRCVRASELQPDIRILPNGIDTEIGDRGVNLSGGQKARVAISRALYRTLRYNLELIVLDDCFSALDPHVGLTIFRRLLLDLLHDRTRIVVLNSQMHLLEHFDRIVAVEDGKIAINAPAKEALLDPRLAEIVALAPSEPVDEEELDDSQTNDAEDDTSSAASLSEEEDPKKPDAAEAALAAGRRPESQLSERDNSSLIFTTNANRKEDGRLYSDENRKRGTLDTGTYRVWAKASYDSSFTRVVVFISLFLLFTLGQIFKVAGDYWLGVWADEGFNTKIGLGVFGGITALLTIFVLGRSVLFIEVAVRSAVNLHNMLIVNLLRAPTNLFFDVTPAGRIINRISSDLDKVDQFLPEQTFNFLSNLFQILSTLVLCTVASPLFLAFLVPVIFLFVYFGFYFARTSRELKRLESISRSPLFSNFAETLSGISTVRAFSLEESLNRKNEFLINTNAKAFLLFWMAARWLAFRLDLLTTLLQVAISIIAILLVDSLDPNLIALAIVYSTQLTGMLQFTIRLFVEVQNAFTSVERLNFLANSIPQEKPAHIPATKPQDPNWPANGAIEFQNVTMRYRPDLDLVLRGVSFRIEGGEKVGIVGRTGAGKSSISVILFRMVDPLETGKIILDGVDIATLGLADLRQNIGIIPQNPVMFSGSLRFNLDPWSRHSDETIKQALERVQLSKLANSKDGLDLELHDRGSNLSVGERQLISIARSVLQGARLIMADEATANVDTLSDSLVQKTIREQFKTQTVLTIAHRLQTIADSDKILVLSFGKVVEFDSPANLMANPDSMYSGMLKESNLQ